MIDFDAAWRHLQQTTKAPDDCQRWNKKAARYDSRDAKNLYAEAFVELARVQPGETVFDMGCGTGTLAAEMATRGHKVIVGDFSSGMLAKLRENMALRGIKIAESLDALTPGSVFPLRMSWEDDWSQFRPSREHGRCRIRHRAPSRLPTCEARCASFPLSRDVAAVSP